MELFNAYEAFLMNRPYFYGDFLQMYFLISFFSLLHIAIQAMTRAKMRA